jgi:1-acyl-sn-glycerol-3-phosphate acyltransferase
MSSPIGRSSPRPENRLDCRLLRAVNVIFSRLYHNTRILTPQPLPRNGPGILIANHISGLDPLLIQSVCSRLIVWMMAREYYEIPQLNGIFRAISAIPVDRSGRDMPAMRSALRALDSGRILGIFPEGKIEPNHDLLPFQTGVALMASRAGVPIYPAYLDGIQRNLSMREAYIYRQRAALAFGRPIVLAGRPDLEQATNQIQQAVENLRQFVRSRIL